MRIEGAEIRKVRESLSEDQTVFGARFGVHRRTVIRWEKSEGHWFSNRWSSNSPSGTPGKPESERWEEAVKLAAAKHSKRKSTTALATRKSKPARRRKRACKVVVVNPRRGSVARRLSVAKAKKKSRTRRAKR